MATTKNRSRAPVPEPPKRRVPVVGIVFGLLAVLIVATIVLSGGSEAGPQFGDVALEGEVLPPYPEGQTSFETDPALGATIPTITGIDLDGNAMSIGADGVAKGIAFLAHWCSHCQAEVPRVTEWVASTGGVEGVEIVSVATSTNPVATNYPPDEWLREENWPAEAMRDDESGTAHFAYGAGGFPYWVFVNADGEVVARTAGELGIDTLESLLLLAKNG